MTDAAQTPARKRAFSKIVPMDITFTESVSKRTTAGGTAFKISPKATVTFPNGETVTRTVMGFGDQVMALKGLAKGKTVRVAAQKDGGSVKIIGAVRETAAAA